MAGSGDIAERDAQCQRSVRVDLSLRGEYAEWRQRVLNSIRAYRAALRHAFGVFVEAQDAGAQLEWTEDTVRVRPNNHAARVIAGLATGQATIARTEPEGERVRGQGDTYTVQLGRGAVYELRAELGRQLPTVLSFVLDSARRDLQSAWTARDPEFPQTTRGWLTLQGARGCARFQNRGIGCPVVNGRPKLNGRTLILKWDREIGEVPFALSDMDGGRWHVWRSLADGDDGWKLGTIYLSERDGQLFVILTHTRPASAADVQPDRPLTVTVLPDDPETLLQCSGPDGGSFAPTADVIGSAAVRAMLAEHAARRAELERRRGDCGSPRRPWGHRKGWADNQRVLDRHTLIRERVVQDYNHAWSRRLVSRAVSWRCGVIRVGPLPQRSFNGGPAIGSIGNHPWNWHQFRQCLTYKAAERGIVVVFEE